MAIDVNQVSPLPTAEAQPSATLATVWRSVATDSTARSARCTTTPARSTITQRTVCGPHRQNTLMVGFVRDAQNYSVMWVGHGDHRIGFDTVSDGRLMPNGGNGNVPFAVQEGDRIAMVLSGTWMTGYVERDGVWHRVHTAVANGTDDLTDPAVRAQYRYAVALRGDEGTLKIGEFIAAER